MLKGDKWMLIEEMYIVAIIILKLIIFNKLWIHNGVTGNILANIKGNNSV